MQLLFLPSAYLLAGIAGLVAILALLAVG